MRVGVIGTGVMGLHHARIYSGMEKVELAGVFDVDAGRAGAVAERFGTTACTSVEDLMAAGLEAVSIAVPTRGHEAVVRSCARSGLGILLEKPIAESIETAERILEECDRNAVKLMVGFVERFNPVVAAIRDALKDNEIISIDITRVGPLPPRVKDVGVIVDLATHDIDLLRFLTGREIESIYTLFSSTFSQHEDNAMLSLEMEGGVMAHITVNWITPFKARRIQIATHKKFIEGDMLNKTAQEFGKYHEDDSYQVKPLVIQSVEPLRREIEAFLDYVRLGGDSPISGRDASRALEIACRCTRNEKVLLT